MRAVITCLLAIGPLPKTPTTSLDWEQEGLSCAAFNVSHTDETTDEPNLATTIAPVVTRHGSRQPTPPASPGKMPPPAPVAPPPQTQEKTQRNPGTQAVITRKGKQRTCRHSPAPQKPKQPPPTAPPEETPHSTPVASPPRTRTRKRRDQDTSEPMPPTQETATPADTALSQGEHQGPYPTMVQWIADLFRKPQELVAWQREDSHLLGKVQDSNNGGTGGEYVTDDDGLLWYAPPGSALRLAIPRSLVPGVLAFAHTTYGHPGVARTTELTQRKYHWTSLKSDVRDYVLSCGCRRLKRSTSQRVAMLPARFLKPWEVLEMDIHDMGARSEAGNRLLLVVVDRASKFLFAYPLPNKRAEGVARKLLELMLTFGIPLSLRSDPDTEFTAEVVQHLCK